VGGTFHDDEAQSSTGRWMRTSGTAPAMVNRWISLVPSKMV
jgi:hypothetical protein